MKLFELLDAPTPGLTYKTGTTSIASKTVTQFSSSAMIGAYLFGFSATQHFHNPNRWIIEFSLRKKTARGFGGHRYGLVDTDGLELKIFSAVTQSMREFISKFKPIKLEFSAIKDDSATINTRARLYKRLCDRLASSFGYKLTDVAGDDWVNFTLEKI